MTRVPRPVRVACALLVLVVTAGCGAGVGGTGDKGYVDGSGVITQLDPSERSKPGNVAGVTLDGAEVALSQYLGKVVVINVWGSWCPPCRSEADDLAEAANELQPQGVVFLGINTRDVSIDNALAFQRQRAVPYASIFDPGGKNLLAFRGTLTPASIPSTVIIDAQGRVAASILGEVTSATTLIDVVEDVRR
ncbi:MAG: TlpA disulfide reductase family protein [Propionibacteriales bacterium]|nr:TlpA disulfide reductase family protein [Propionibacteriales bacterium]